jgi:tripartite-type tricarboxylate transporter receptor subunit TctC
VAIEPRSQARALAIETQDMPKWKALLISLVVLGSQGSWAADRYPSRPVTMVVPYPAGGPNDTLARIMAERMRVSLGQPVIIENVAGASGSIGIGRVARAAPDGYTLDMSGWAGHVVNGAVLALQYDVANDFEPIALIASNPLLIVGKKTTPAKDLKELIAWLKANPNKALLGTGGGGGATTIAGLFFQKQTGTRFQFVSYRGLPQAMQDLMAGQIDLMIDVAANSLSQMRAGTIKAYAVTAGSRLAMVSNIPTVDEAGLPGFYISQWTAIWAPKGTPNDIVAKLNAAAMDALTDPAVRSRFSDLTQEIPPREQQTPEALRAYHKAEIVKWWPIIKAAGIKAE